MSVTHNCCNAPEQSRVGDWCANCYAGWGKQQRPITAAYDSFKPFLEQARGAWPELCGTDAQIASLIADALDVIDPDSAMAGNDAIILARQFRYIAEEATGDAEYSDEATDGEG